MGQLLVWAVAAGGFAAGAVGVAMLGVVEWAAWVLVLPGRRPGEMEQGLRPGEAIEAVAHDGVRLAGTWHAADPTGKGLKRRVVLLIHGFAEGPDALRARTEALNRHGWDVAALDTRAHGRSGGDRGSFGGREGADVSAWVDALAELGKLDKAAPRVAVWGRSMGAAIAARGAVDDPRVTALVMEAPYLDLRATLAGILRRRRIPFPGTVAELILNRARRLAGVSLERPRPIDLVARVFAPALVIHGADDSLIPSADARTLALAFPRPAPMVEVPGAGHNAVVDVGGPELLERVAAFLDAADAESESESRPIRPGG